MNILCFKSCFQRAVQNQWTNGSTRTLFSKTFLGIKDYELRRSIQLDYDSSKVLGTDTGKLAAYMKYWCHVLKRKECIDRFSEIQSNLREIYSNPVQRKIFNFGPLVMRMFHYMNLPKQALTIYNDEQIKMWFSELQSKILISDLLFKHEMYDELLHIVKMNIEIQEKIKKGLSTELNCLAFAAYYKLNTLEHLRYGLELWEKLPEETQLYQSRIFLCMLAINLGQPTIALDLLKSNIKSHFVPVMVQLIALADCGYYIEGAQFIEEQKTKFPKFSIYTCVVERIKESLKKYPSTEDSAKFLKLLDTIPLFKWQYTIDEMLCFPIDPNGGNNRWTDNYRNPKIHKLKKLTDNKQP